VKRHVCSLPAGRSSSSTAIRSHSIPFALGFPASWSNGLTNSAGSGCIRPTHRSENAGTRLVTDPGDRPIRPEDLEVGAVAQTLPELATGEKRTLNNIGKDAVLLIRLRPEEFNLDAERLSWTHEGIIAFSKICSHMGCAVALYEQQTKHLLCPCHQSTFDVTRAAKVIFGPAARPLPQLAITVDAEGYLVAKAPFNEPVGPSFWERSS